MLNIFVCSVVFALTLSYVAKHPDRKRLGRIGLISTLAFTTAAVIIVASIS